MSEKAKRAMWRAYWACLGLLALVVVLCVPRAQAICNVPPYGQVDVAYYSPTNITGSGLGELFVGVGSTNRYEVYVTSNAPMLFQSTNTSIFMFMSNGIPVGLCWSREFRGGD